MKGPTPYSRSGQESGIVGQLFERLSARFVGPSGIETTRFLALGRNDGARRERGLDGRVVAGTIAAATPEKGLDVLSRAGTILAGESGGAEIVFLALSPGGWEMPNLRRVDPAETTVEEFLSLLDLYVAPSREEGLSTALMAAVAAGLPVVGSRTGGIPEIAGEDHAVLVPPGDAALLARVIRSLAASEERRRALGRRARERGRLFDIEGTVDGTLSVYRTVLATP